MNIIDSLYIYSAIIVCLVLGIVDGTRAVKKRPFGLCINGIWLNSSAFTLIASAGYPCLLPALKMQDMFLFLGEKWSKFTAFLVLVVLYLTACIVVTKIVTLIKIAIMQKTITGAYAAYRKGRKIYKSHKRLFLLKQKGKPFKEAEADFRSTFSIPAQIPLYEIPPY